MWTKIKKDRRVELYTFRIFIRIGCSILCKEENEPENSFDMGKQLLHLEKKRELRVGELWKLLIKKNREIFHLILGVGATLSR